MGCIHSDSCRDVEVGGGVEFQEIEFFFFFLLSSIAPHRHCTCALPTLSCGGVPVRTGTDSTEYL